MSRKPKLKKMRCFVGLRFTLHEPLAELMADLKICTMEPNIRLRIYSPEDLHITLKFLGSVTEDRLLSIQSSLSLLAANCHPLNLQCRGIGVFKNSLWIGIETDRYLSLITSQLDEAFAILGCSREQRPYTPHITLARFNREQKARITLLQEKYAGQRWGALKAGKLYLYRSDTLAEGARYTILKGYTLSALP